MASLLDKVRTLVSADLNRLADRALRSNEAAVFQHHVRKLQALQDELTGQLAGVRAEITGMRRRADEQQALLVKQDQEVDALLQAGLQEDALAAQERLNATRVTVAHLTSQVEKLEAEYAQMVEAQAQLKARVTALQQSAPEVDGLVGMARAKDLAASTAKSLEDLEGAGDPDVARVVGSIRDRLSVAETQIQDLEQRALSHGETPDVLKRNELEAQLEARKARLGMPTATPASPPPAPAAPPAPVTPLAPAPPPDEKKPE
jgi:phage shock protein A